MKSSYYNYIFHDGGFAYWYNAMSGCYFRLSSGLSRKVEYVLLNQIAQIPSLLPEAMIEKLTTNGFILPKEVNELDLLRQKHQDAVHRKNYFLVILPTLNCNYRCWYCIQKHVPSVMKDDTKAAIMRHLDYMIDVKGIESLHLDWFGGEPFMFYQQVIVPISQYAISRCAEKGIPFMNSATTNGYFLGSKINSMLAKLKFQQFQITLDGDKRFHDSVKFTKGCTSTFEHVLRNINAILAAHEGITVFLRINYTHKTLSVNIVDEVNDFISVCNRSKIVILPKKVWQEDVDKSFGATLKSILDAFSASGYRVSRWSGDTGFISCYVNQEYYNAINFNGHVVKCTACDDLYASSPKGILRSDGIIDWQDNYDLKCLTPTFENERCLKCRKLPSCMGLCPRDFMAGGSHCKFDAMDEIYEENLKNYLIHQFDSEG